MEEPLRIRIRDMNAHIVCSLCAGYFIDATTIMECLHTFCRSCIVKFLQTSKCCPQCNMKIHETQPVMQLKADRVMQDVVFKLVPSLFENEEKRRMEFYRSRGFIVEKKKDDSSMVVPLTPPLNRDGHHYRHDELICMRLERYSAFASGRVGGFQLGALPKRYVRCSVRVCVHHVQRLLRRKLNVPQHCQVELLCKGKVLDWSMSLKYIWLAHWISRPSPLILYYRLAPEDDRHTRPLDGQNPNPSTNPSTNSDPNTYWNLNPSPSTITNANASPNQNVATNPNPNTNLDPTLAANPHASLTPTASSSPNLVADPDPNLNPNPSPTLIADVTTNTNANPNINASFASNPNANSSLTDNSNSNPA